MNTAWNEFKYSIAEVKKIRTIYDHMIANVRLSQEEFYKLKYCSTVVYMVPRA